MYYALICIGNLKVEETGPSNKLVVTVSATVVVFLVISILTLIGGCVCGYYFRGRKYNKKTQDNPLSSQPAAAPHYEEVNVLPSAMEHQGQGLELKENVAYGPSKSNS